ncbi:hypothetical protein CT0861_03133 [Colletotrichum tofieldiae]|uniref:Uncharacterized protein n=1 Tax=Colletotrichum tofieldiae TaxID=708197 RepID=A0A166YA41_9PEZI|nr:hypothetical protein CT0861_03133 [Colletotrichum tofieldiae]
MSKGPDTTSSLLGRETILLANNDERSQSTASKRDEIHRWIWSQPPLIVQTTTDKDASGPNSSQLDSYPFHGRFQSKVDDATGDEISTESLFPPLKRHAMVEDTEGSGIAIIRNIFKPTSILGKFHLKH